MLGCHFALLSQDARTGRDCGSNKNSLQATHLAINVKSSNNTPVPALISPHLTNHSTVTALHMVLNLTRTNGACHDNKCACLAVYTRPLNNAPLLTPMMSHSTKNVTMTATFITENVAITDGACNNSKNSFQSTPPACEKYSHACFDYPPSNQGCYNDGATYSKKLHPSHQN